jgi:hypothetical protein
MSKLLKKLKPGTRVIDIESGKEGWVTYDDLPLPNSITVEFELNENNNIGAITYPISDIENRIKLADKYSNYKIGDRVKDVVSFKVGKIFNICDCCRYPITVIFKGEENHETYSILGKSNIEDSNITLKRLKVKKPK